MIDKNTIEKIARLAKIKITPDKIDYFSSQLESILELMNSMKDVDCGDIRPLRSVHDLNLRTREDIVNEAALDTEIFSNAPHQTSELAKKVKCFIVPKVIE